MRTAYFTGCISHGFNHATNGGAVLLSYLSFLKKIRVLYVLPLLVIFTLSSLPLPAASAAMVTLSWDANSEPDLAGYVLHHGTSSRDYLDGVDVGNTTGCTISGLEPGQIYKFKVYATNAMGDSPESSYSNEILVPLTTSVEDTELMKVLIYQANTGIIIDLNTLTVLC